MEAHDVNVWLVNTGWTGGPYGVGERISLKYTRAMITAALNGSLSNAGFRKHSIFGADIPTTCPGVPGEILSPRETWKDDLGFYKVANALSDQFNDNFKKFEEFANDEIMAGAPKRNTKYL